MPRGPQPVDEYWAARIGGSFRDGYVNIAEGLARDLPRLAELRTTLRARMRASPLTDAAGFVRGVERAYREMWERWRRQTPSGKG
jgi:protein O-GlcNAc transferase